MIPSSRLSRASKVLVILVVVALLGLGIHPAYGGVDLSSDEAKMLVLLNRERTSRGLPALEVDPRLTEVARDHSREMIALDYFSHTSPVHGVLSERLEKAGLRKWETAGENLAGAPDCEEARSALLQSPEHRANILDPSYTHVGIGVVDGGPYGKMFTQDFAEHTGATASSSSGQEIGTEVSVEAPSGTERFTVASTRLAPLEARASNGTSGVEARRATVDGNILLLIGSLLSIEVLLRILEDKKRRYAFLQALGRDWHFVAGAAPAQRFAKQ
ncbi:MAG: CAP domain-containing protein [Actinomycetota bacterium]|nr:CAP domain-containing protein [Actinomycetota bacterium]